MRENNYNESDVYRKYKEAHRFWLLGLIFLFITISTTIFNFLTTMQIVKQNSDTYYDQRIKLTPESNKDLSYLSYVTESEDRPELTPYAETGANSELDHNSNEKRLTNQAWFFVALAGKTVDSYFKWDGLVNNCKEHDTVKKT